MRRSKGEKGDPEPAQDDDDERKPRGGWTGVVSVVPLVAAVFLFGILMGSVIVDEKTPVVRRSLRAVKNEANPTFSGREVLTKKPVRSLVSGYAEARGPFDSESVTMGAWIFLDGGDRSKSIKTIVANKGTGCDVGQDGFALAINEWETNDQQLTLEWGDVASGCRKLLSGSSKVPYDEWTHVAATLESDGTAKLFINGDNVAQVSGGLHSRHFQRVTRLRLAQYPEGVYPFVGNLSSVVIALASSNNDATAMATLTRPGSVDDWIKEHALEKSEGLAVDLTDAPIYGAKATDALDYHMTMIQRTLQELPEESLPVPPPPPRKPGGFAMGLASGSHDEVGPDEQRRRADSVREAMRHAWTGYKAHAWGRDELKPVSGRGSDNWGGLAVTMVDSLDTLWMMGLRDEFDEAERWIAEHLRFDHTGDVSVFETTIRELGGLLAAYDLSKRDVFLTKAADLGRRLATAFETPTGLPMGSVSLREARKSNHGWTGGNAVLAELGTLQLEFRYLAAKTGDSSFAEKANQVFVRMAALKPPNGLYPIFVNTASGQLSSRKITFGALGDSFYEYLLKTWIQGGKTEDRLRTMYDAAVDGIVDKLLQKSSPSNLAYVADLENGNFIHKMDHLVCFLPGSLALGAYTDPNGIDSPRAQRDLDLAKALAYTCYQMYERTATKLAPEFVNFGGPRDFDVGASAPFNILRPETAESLFILYHLTKDPIYRDWSFRIFQAFDSHCKTPIAFGALADVRRAGNPDDRMESFFLAETLKYLFLIQDSNLDPNFDLTDTVVFNTEAHPLGVLGPSGNHIAPGLFS